MKKLMLCSIFSILFFNAYSQDTLCTYFTGKRVIEFNYYTSEILYEVEQEEKFYEIELTYGDVLCLHFSDDKKRFRKVITEYFRHSIKKLLHQLLLLSHLGQGNFADINYLVSE